MPNFPDWIFFDFKNHLLPYFQIAENVTQCNSRQSFCNVLIYNITILMPFILQSNGHTIGDGGEGDHPLAPHSKHTYGAATTSLTAATDDEDMIDITPRSSPGELIGGGPGSYHRETATESDTERDYAPNQRTMHHHHQLQHQHVPSHSAFGDPMDGE